MDAPIDNAVLGPMPQPRDRSVDYELTIRQEPKQARMCGVGGKADRRPIDPPPIIQLRVIDNTPKDSPDAQPDQDPTAFLQNPYYFMFACLAKPDDDTELHWLKDGRTKCTTGSVVSSLYHLRDTESADNSDVGLFVFPDLSVRTEGSYRLKLSLYEIVGNHVRHCKSIFSAPFYVYTAKKFPGMEESTPLSCSLADQGIKIRIRKDIRTRKRPPPQNVQLMSVGAGNVGGSTPQDHNLMPASSQDPPSPDSSTSSSPEMERREGKRRRLDDSNDQEKGSERREQWGSNANGSSGAIDPSLGLSSSSNGPPIIPPPPGATRCDTPPGPLSQTSGAPQPLDKPTSSQSSNPSYDRQAPSTTWSQHPPPVSHHPHPVPPPVGPQPFDPSSTPPAQQAYHYPPPPVHAPPQYGYPPPHPPPQYSTYPSAGPPSHPPPQAPHPTWGYDMYHHGPPPHAPPQHMHAPPPPYGQPRYDYIYAPPPPHPHPNSQGGYGYYDLPPPTHYHYGEYASPHQPPPHAVGPPPSGGTPGKDPETPSSDSSNPTSATHQPNPASGPSPVPGGYPPPPRGYHYPPPPPSHWYSMQPPPQHPQYHHTAPPPAHPPPHQPSPTPVAAAAAPRSASPVQQSQRQVAPPPAHPPPSHVQAAAPPPLTAPSSSHPHQRSSSSDGWDGSNAAGSVSGTIGPGSTGSHSSGYGNHHHNSTSGGSGSYGHHNGHHYQTSGGASAAYPPPGDRIQLAPIRPRPTTVGPGVSGHLVDAAVAAAAERGHESSRSKNVLSIRSIVDAHPRDP